jgi:hypothetical protein
VPGSQRCGQLRDGRQQRPLPGDPPPQHRRHARLLHSCRGKSADKTDTLRSRHCYVALFPSIQLTRLCARSMAAFCSVQHDCATLPVTSSWQRQAGTQQVAHCSLPHLPGMQRPPAELSAAPPVCGAAAAAPLPLSTGRSHSLLDTSVRTAGSLMKRGTVVATGCMGLVAFQKLRSLMNTSKQIRFVRCQVAS